MLIIAGNKPHRTYRFSYSIYCLYLPLGGWYLTSHASTVTSRTPLPLHASSRFPVAATVTERSAPSCPWPPSWSKMLLLLRQAWLRRIPLCTSAVTVPGCDASQSWPQTFHITGVKSSSSAARSTSGAGRRMVDETISRLRRSHPQWRNCTRQAPSAHARAVPRTMTDGSSDASRGDRLDVWRAQFQAVPVPSRRSEEGRTNLMARQYVKQSLGIRVIRSVVEGKCGLWPSKPAIRVRPKIKSRAAWRICL